MLNALKQQRRMTVTGLSAQLHITDAATRSAVEVLLRAGLVEARGSSTACPYMFSGSTYSQSGKEAGYVRQSDIDKIRYPKLIMKPAERRDGSVATYDVEIQLRLYRKQAYRLLVKLVEDETSSLFAGAVVPTTRLRKRAGREWYTDGHDGTMVHFVGTCPVRVQSLSHTIVTHPGLIAVLMRKCVYAVLLLVQTVPLPPTSDVEHE